MMRRVGWIRMLGLLCAGVCAGPGMLAQNPTTIRTLPVGNGASAAAIAEPRRGRRRQRLRRRRKRLHSNAQRTAQPSPAANTTEAVDECVHAAGGECSAEWDGDDDTCAVVNSTCADAVAGTDVYVPAAAGTNDHDGGVFPAGRHEESAFAWASGGTSDGPATNGTWIQVAAVEREPAVFGRERKWRTGDWRVRAAGRYEETAFEWECGWDFWRTSDGPVTNGTNGSNGSKAPPSDANPPKSAGPRMGCRRTYRSRRARGSRRRRRQVLMCHRLHVIRCRLLRLRGFGLREHR